MAGPDTDDNALVRDLKKEDFSARLETELKASVNDRNNDVCSVRVVTDPTETPRFSVLPVKSEVPSVIEPVRVLR